MNEIPETLIPPLKKPPLFVIGPLRSGTSLLYALLNQHPKIALMYECDVWNFPRMFSKLRFRGDWKERLEFYNRPLSRHRLNFAGSLRGLESVRTPHDLYKAFAEAKDALVCGEKSPFYCTRLCQLAKEHPGSSFVLIWRDPLEVRRSLDDAARRSGFFRQPGMLSRFIYYQEKMIQDAGKLTRAGHRVYHVTYDDLIDRTEECCRGICNFLQINFDDKMLDLRGADLTAVFRAPQHEYLRRGKIERREYSALDADLRIVEKMGRFRNRWNRLGGHKFQVYNGAPRGSEPALPELLYHRMAGAGLSNLDGAKRLAFEFLPLPWLRTYRQAKAWFWAGSLNARGGRPSLWDEFRSNKETILLSLIILAAVALTHHLTGAAVTLMPFYIIPAAILALVINGRWGTFAAVASALVWAFLQNLDNPLVNLSHPGVWLWDTLMRFGVVEIVVLLLERIRVEINAKKALNE